MWFGLILTLVLSFGLARILTSLQFGEITANWKNYRCIPHVMLAASMFKPADDPRSSMEYTADNFSFCCSEIAKSALNVALKPVFDIFYQLTSSATQSIGFAMNLRTLASNMFKGLNSIFEIFNRRFGLTLHEIHKSFVKQYNAMQRANGIAISAVFAGMSFVQSIMNFIKLMVIIVVSILVILVVIAILLFFLLAPVTPLILASIVTAGAFGGAVGGMASAFCFAPNTPIVLENGESKSIADINIGDKLLNGTKVTALMKFKAKSTIDLRNIDGIFVSGSHIVYDNNKVTLVKDNKLSERINNSYDYLYCLNTSDHKIPVKGLAKIWTFADWEELDNNNMKDWTLLVNSILNPNSGVPNLNPDLIESECGFEQTTPILCKGPDGQNVIKQIQQISIGDIIQDGSKWTTVVGTVLLDECASRSVGVLDSYVCSGANWLYDGTKWIRACDMKNWTKNTFNVKLYSLFTESGSFSCNGVKSRDFSEVGLDGIESTYEFTLSRLIKSSL